MGEYHLSCLECAKVHDDAKRALACSSDHDALLRSVYSKRRIDIRDDMPGIFRYIDWLPATQPLDVESCPVTYKSQGLAEELALEELYISFNGYWPERGARVLTCTFKELEAPPTVARYTGLGDGTMVLASAGNTARSFAWLCSKIDFRLLVVVPYCGLRSIWSPEPQGGSVRLVALKDGMDYYDAISLADSIGKADDHFPEGGVRNIARRDGMGTVVLNAVETVGRVPDHYFQAVGSGTGAIAAWEANLRLMADGRYGANKMRLHLAQNAPFTPITDSWSAGSREMCMMPEAEARERVSRTYTTVLSNRNPPYSVKGGVYDALLDTGGLTYSVSNDEAIAAGRLFERTEGVDVVPAASVAVAALVQAVDNGAVSGVETILLNITGGGVKRLYDDMEIHRFEADLVVESADVEVAWLLEELEGRG